MPEAATAGLNTLRQNALVRLQLTYPQLFFLEESEKIYSKSANTGVFLSENEKVIRLANILMKNLYTV